MTPPRQPRADAARNRITIMNVARQQITEYGPDVSMSQIAAAAGVAVGTLYRHFPTKADLVSMVVADSVDELVHAAESAWQRVYTGQAEPAAELLSFISHVLDTTAHNKAVKAAARTLGAMPDYAEAENQAVTALSNIIDAGIKAETLRRDLTVNDMYLLTFRLPADISAEDRQRWLDLIRPGLLREG